MPRGRGDITLSATILNSLYPPFLPNCDLAPGKTVECVAA
jgi:hypothetical protein